MKSFFKNYLLLVLLLPLLWCPRAESAEQAILVVGNAAGNLDLESLREIYFNNGGRLSNGQSVIPIDFREGNSVREQFYLRAFGRTRVQMKAYWAERIFTGKGYPPRTVENAKEAINVIAQKGSEFFIGYINESEATKSLPVLLRIP